MSRIFIVGSGLAGSATGRALLQLGHRVTFVDAAPGRVAALAAEGLDARAVLVLDGEPESFVLLCLPTPSGSDGYRLGALENGAVEVGLALADAGARHTVVVRSTVPPGTTERVIRPLLASCSTKREGLDFSLAASPEFQPGVVVVGARSLRVAEEVRDLLGPLGSPGAQVRLFNDPATAEAIRCAPSSVRRVPAHRRRTTPRTNDRLDANGRLDAGSAIFAIPRSRSELAAGPASQLHRIPRQFGH